MKLNAATLAKVLPAFDRMLPRRVLQQAWTESQPRGYRYLMNNPAVPKVAMCAYLRRVGSTRKLVERWGEQLGTRSHSTLCEALGDLPMHRFVERLCSFFRLGARNMDGHLVAIDSMAVTLPATRRSSALRFNDATLGGGVMWALDLDARPGQCPLELLALVRGAWHDGNQFLRKRVRLVPGGPTYLMDRGFFSLDVLGKLLGQGVRFVMRARRINFRVAEFVGDDRAGAKKIGSVRVEYDRVALVGLKSPVRLRVVCARTAGGEDLILVTNQWKWSTAQVLAAYKRRWEIERAHKLVKDVIGLAHLYSFRLHGIETQLRLAFMLAALLWMSAKNLLADVVNTIRSCLKQIRAQLDVERWSRNLSPRSYKKRLPQLCAPQ